MKDLTLGPGSIEWAGTIYRTILETKATDGAMSIVDSVSPPNYGPPRHIHHDADETFVILSGEVELWLDGERLLRIEVLDHFDQRLRVAFTEDLPAPLGETPFQLELPDTVEVVQG